MGRLIRGPIRLERGLSRNIRVSYALQVVTGFFIWAPVWILYLTESRGLSLGQVAAAAARSAARPIAYGSINRCVDSARRATVLSVFELVIGAAWFTVIFALVLLVDRMPLQSARGTPLGLLRARTSRSAAA